MTKSARQLAFEVLCKIEKDKAYSNLAIDSAVKTYCTSSTDCSFISYLVYGVVERKITLDFVLQKHLNQPVGKLKKEVLTILRLGAYQILFSQKVPNSAAVNESVKLAKSNKLSFASAMVNAVLRRVNVQDLVLGDEMPEEEKISVGCSAPLELVKFFVYHYGVENTRQFLQSALDAKKIYIKVNTVKTTLPQLIERLAQEGVECEPCSVENALLIKLNGAVYDLQCFKDGLFHVEDLSSQLCVKALQAFEGCIALDVCSAPGGKSFSIAEDMANKGTLYSCDIYEQRVGLIENGAQRLGLSCIQTLVNDASVFNDNIPLADRVLCDVPCSGLGIIGKKPEIKYKKLDDIKPLIPLQKQILEVSSKYVKKGGRLVYSTCSVNPNENRKVCDAFLKEHPEFKAVPVLPEIARTIDEGSYLTLMPHTNNCDGFFIAAFEKE